MSKIIMPSLSCSRVLRHGDCDLVDSFGEIGEIEKMVLFNCRRGIGRLLVLFLLLEPESVALFEDIVGQTFPDEIRFGAQLFCGGTRLMRRRRQRYFTADTWLGELLLLQLGLILLGSSTSSNIFVESIASFWRWI